MTHGHEVWWASVPGTRSLLKRIGDSVDRVTYVSDYCRDRIAAALSADAAARMVRLSPTVDRARFRPGCGGAEVRRRHGIGPDRLVVVCVSRLVRRKGQDTLVRIWPEVLEEFPGAVLLLVGDGPQRARLERMVARRGLEGAVRFTGSVPWEEVPAHLHAGCRTSREAPCRRAGGSLSARRRDQLQLLLMFGTPVLTTSQVSSKNASRITPPSPKATTAIRAATAATSSPYSTALAPYSSRPRVFAVLSRRVMNLPD